MKVDWKIQFPHWNWCFLETRGENNMFPGRDASESISNVDGLPMQQDVHCGGRSSDWSLIWSSADNNSTHSLVLFQADINESTIRLLFLFRHSCYYWPFNHVFSIIPPPHEPEHSQVLHVHLSMKANIRTAPGRIIWYAITLTQIMCCHRPADG